MKPLIIIIGALVVIGLTFTLVNSQSSPQEEKEKAKTAASHSKHLWKETSLATPELKPAVSATVSKMPLEERITQLFYVGVEGTTLTPSEEKMIADGKVGGVIFLGRNIQNSDQFQSLVNGVKKANATNPTPLFLGVDEEGGRVSRIPTPLKKLPSSYEIGAENDPELAFTAGELLARKVKAFGLNMNFAPVLDINNNPDNQVIGDRSFGDTPKRVTQMGVAEMKGIQSEGIIPVLKHFPGHGDTSVDSHVNLPVIEKSMSQIDDFELNPFKEAIDQGADAVMTAHILFPELDEEQPATFSSTIIQNLLREKADFDGLVITDDMGMGAISKNFGTNEAAINAIQAGSDMVLLTDTRNKNFNRVKEALLKAVKEGAISEKQIDDSVTRILRTKEKYNLSKDSRTDIDIEKLNEQITKLRNETN
ncbi:beta-N-acetylhexosaminidase [Halobacillus mangrovi]|uniref:beta-N-acetylhexosaminidase n=1 Tax=Halobacillus mangrovi TaxID=402384 RepID=A0A1W5ZRF6_9BACI|nr:beta-N-acetylhexosaminidase [Halobacillus mangrovi]ARI75869.1 beta-N-acetylhexosaminidase [Halobacillus mangrovi]